MPKISVVLHSHDDELTDFTTNNAFKEKSSACCSTTKISFLSLKLKSRKFSNLPPYIVFLVALKILWIVATERTYD